jgi:hypothetical protein
MRPVRGTCRSCRSLASLASPRVAATTDRADPAGHVDQSRGQLFDQRSVLWPALFCPNVLAGPRRGRISRALARPPRRPTSASFRAASCGSKSARVVSAFTAIVTMRRRPPRCRIFVRLCAMACARAAAPGTASRSAICRCAAATVSAKTRRTVAVSPAPAATPNAATCSRPAAHASKPAATPAAAVTSASATRPAAAARARNSPTPEDCDLVRAFTQKRLGSTNSTAPPSAGPCQAITALRFFARRYQPRNVRREWLSRWLLVKRCDSRCGYP